MRVRAVWKIKGLNPFKVHFCPDDFIQKTVEVPDSITMKEVEQLAKEDHQEGYEFLRVEKVDNGVPLTPKKEKS